jgi:hypothetical protein
LPNQFGGGVQGWRHGGAATPGFVRSQGRAGPLKW